MSERLKSRRILYLVVAVNVILLMVNGVFLVKNFDNKDTATSASNEFQYLSKRIFVENQNDIIINFVPLRTAMHEYVGKQNGNVGAYFEYLPSGTSIGANDQMEVKLASLGKIPVVMAVYKAIEKGRLSLDKNVTITKEDLDPTFGSLWEKGEGTTLSVQEAIELSLIKSDNTAIRMLSRLLSEKDILEVLDALNIPRSREEEGFYIISPKNYTSILRSLYLSSYLKGENSNQILKILTKTDFSDKLPAGVSKDVAVAHKIGTFNFQSGAASQSVFSDCGIVYEPSRPYSLCIMVKGGNEEVARQHMIEISKMVYSYVAKVR